MSDYKNNPTFKALLTEIGSKSNTGRINLDWRVITEAKKKSLKQEAKNERPPEEELDKDNAGQGEEAPAQPAPEAGADSSPKAPAAPQPGKATPVGKSPAAPAPEGGEEVDKAKEDALKASAELEKAKAEKGEAEEELKEQSYIHLVSQGGVTFLLGKLLDHAFKTNTIDSLATEMVQKLKIQNQEEFQLFSDEMIPFKNIPGAAELLSAMSGLVGQQAA
jgi:hypothetical protein